MLFHDMTLKEHTTQLGFLMMNVSEITRSIQALRAEVQDGFQRQQWPPPSLFTTSGSLGASTSTPMTPDELQLSTKHVKLPSFNGSDPVGLFAKAETYLAVHGAQ